MSKLTIGLVGAGLIGEEHAISLSRIRTVDLTIFDVDSKRAAAMAKRHGAATAKSLEALIDGCDLVWIATPPAFHKSVVAAACKAGKSIFCEKPLAHTAQDARAIAKLVERAGVLFYMGQSARFNRVFENIVKQVAKGTIGEPTLVWSTRLGYLERSSPAAAPWRYDNKISGGVIVELGVHEIDFIRWAGGDWLTASAVESSRTLAPGKFQDSVVAVGTLASGANARLEVSWADPRYVWQRGVTGTKGSLFWCDSNFTEIAHHRPGKAPRAIKSPDWRHPKTGENMAIREQDRAVLRCLTDGGDFPVTIADGVAAVTSAMAIRKSADSGRTVKI